MGKSTINGPCSIAMLVYRRVSCIYIYIYGPPSLHVSPPPPPHGLGPQVVAPIPFYLQAIGSISEVQRRIC